VISSGALIGLLEVDGTVKDDVGKVNVEQLPVLSSQLLWSHGFYGLLKSGMAGGMPALLMLVLASASPRRQELLRNAGISFVVQATDIAEIPQPREAPEDCAQRLAQEKALAVFRQRPDDLVLGADTIVIVDGEILGKPRNAQDAARMLRLLSGRDHLVTTGVCLVGRQLPVASGQLPVAGSELVDTRAETTRVSMRELSEEDIQSYVATGEPMDKAGAYAIQGLASRWIYEIEGDYFNVVGLPVSLVWQMLKSCP
jgi:septum formation protein